jgi:tetratricopeptide (TPR) repeat protein
MSLFEKNWINIGILLALGLFPRVSHAALESKDGCESSESWTFGAEVPTRYQKRFKRYLSGHMSALEAFAHARRLRNESDNENVELLAEYWLSHAFMKAKIYPMAYRGFAAVLENEVTKSSLPVQSAALSCILKMGQGLEAREIPQEALKIITAMPVSELRSRAAYRWNLQSRSNDAGKFIEAKSVYDFVNRGFDGVRRNQWREAAQSFDQYFLLKSHPSDLKTQESHLKLLAARSHYSMGNFKRAREYYNQIDRSSNEFTEALQEVAWTQLRLHEFNAAIGTALSLQTGWLMSTYSPETIMIMAMAFNETCHFPEALRAMDLFKKQYAPVSDWLSNTKVPNGDFYGLALSALKKEEKVPFRISGEWIRSPIFLNRQQEINEMIKQDDYMVQAEILAKKSQKLMAVDLLKIVASVKKSIAIYRKANPDKDIFNNEINNSLDDLRAGLEDYDTLRSAAPPWKRLRKGNTEMATARRKELVNDINTWIKTLNQQMLYQLADVVEIFRFV